MAVVIQWRRGGEEISYGTPVSLRRPTVWSQCEGCKQAVPAHCLRRARSSLAGERVVNDSAGGSC